MRRLHCGMGDIGEEGAASGPRVTTSFAWGSDNKALEVEKANAAKREREKARNEDLAFERSICISYITDRDFESVLGSEWRARPPTKLDFSDERFKLETLTGPGGGLLRSTLKKRRLTWINVSDNRLHDLNCLTQSNGFEGISCLLAKRNLISSCSLDLPKLIELNLSHNQLQTLPPLDRLPGLEVLMISHNQISGPVEGLMDCPRLKRLDLANNKFMFDPSQLSKALENFGRLRNLQELRLYNNPFVASFSEYQVFVVKALPTLQMLDDVDMGKYSELIRSDIKEAHISELPVYDNAVHKRQERERHNQMDKKADEQGAALGGNLPRLVTMVEYLEEVVADVTVLQRNIKFVHDTAKRRAQHLKILNEMGDFFWEDLIKDEHGNTVATSKANQEMYAAAVSRTLELIDLVMERHDSVRNILIQTIGWLTSVSRHSFGYKCLQRLGRLMLSSEADKAEVLYTLENIVVPCLSVMAEEGNEGLKGRRTRELILGVMVLLENPDNREEVAKVLQKLIPMFLGWLNSSDKAQDLQDGEHIIYALAALTDDEDNAGLVASESIARKCIAAINNQSYALSDKYYELWLDFLHLTENLIEFSDDDFIQLFLKDSVHVTVISRGRAIVSEGGIDETPQKARMVSRIVRFIATMMKKNEQVLLDCCKSYHFTDYLCQLLKDTSDPMVLAEGCRCLLVVFKNDHIYKHQAPAVVQELSRLTQFLKFLGAERYREIFTCAVRHEHKGGHEPQEPPPLTNLEDPLVCDAFVAMIDLFAFFAQDDTPDDGQRDELRDLVSTDLNNNDRDQKLLALLVCPNDDVRLSVMNCIRQVPTDEIAPEEMGMLVKCLSDTRNISEGETEKVLGLVFSLLERLVDSNGPPGVQFRQNYAETAIGEGYLILHQNARRDTYGLESEEDQKLVLSNAIVSFLRACSRRVPLRDHLMSMKIQEMFPEVLKCEEDFHRPYADDVALEQTWTGRSVDNLIKCFQDQNALNRSKRVLFRVLSRIADVMEGVPDFIGDRKEPFGLQELAWKESQMWNDKQVQRNQLHLDDQELEFLRNEANDVRGRLDTILRHLSHMQVRAAERENLDIVDGEARWFRGTVAEGQQRKAAIEEKARKQFTDDNVKPIKLTQDDDDNEVELSGNKVLASAIHQFEDDVDGDDGFLFIHRPDQFTTDENILMDENGNVLPKKSTYKTDYKMNPAYGVCAFLRTLHAALLVPPTEDCRKQVIGDFRKEENVARLCALVETVPYLNCNVAAKFLTVMKLVLDTGTSVRYAPPLEILSLISKYIQRIAEGLLNLLKLTKDRKLDTRETTLCVSVASFMTVAIHAVCVSVRTPVGCEEVRRETISKCIDRLAPSVIVRLLIAMVIYDLQMDLGGGERSRIQMQFVQQAYDKVAIKDSSTRCLVVFLVHCPQHKYNVLEVFNVADVFNQQTVRPCYLAELLNDVTMATYQRFLEGELRSHSPSGLDFRVLTLRRIEMAGTQGNLVQRLLCATTESVTVLAPPEQRPLYTHVDDAAGRWQPAWEAAFPRPPTEVWKRPYSDVACLYRCYGSQLMAIEWKTKDMITDAGANGKGNGKAHHKQAIEGRAGANCGIGMGSGTNGKKASSGDGDNQDVFLFCFQRAACRDDFCLLLRKLSARTVENRARINNDPNIRAEVLSHPQVNDPTGETVLGASVGLSVPKSGVLGWGAGDTKMPFMFVLTLKKVLVFSLDLNSWQAMPDFTEDIDIEDFRPKDLDPPQEDVSLQEGGDGGEDPAQGKEKEKTIKPPKTNVLRYDSHHDLPPKEVIFKTSPEADLVIKFKSGYVMDIRFFDDTEREHWRRALAYCLFRTTQKVWTRDLPVATI